MTPNTIVVSPQTKEAILEALYGEKPEAKKTLDKVKHKSAPWKGELWKKK